MKYDNEPIVNAKRGEGDKAETREFTKTQWDSMGTDKSGWKVAKPTETLKAASDTGATDDERKLLEARERYEVLFGRKPHHSKGLAGLEKDIAEEITKQNQPANGANNNATGTSSTAKPPAAPATGALPPAGESGNNGAGNEGGDAGNADAAANKANAVAE